MPRYDPKRIEPKWQRYWDQNQTFATPDAAPGRKKLYVLDMFPYPSGDGLHVGHPEGYTATDIVCRYNRMRGRQVLHPMGWDAFGLPAEQHAAKTGTHPRETTYKNIDTFRRQLKMLGFSYDWAREFSTTDPDYFRWTQWIFLVLFDTWFDRDCSSVGADGRTRKGRGRPIAELPIRAEIQRQGSEAVRRYQDKHRLAYQQLAPVNWCAALGTVLANEEVIDGKSERGGHPVTRLNLRQWMLRITDYADRLLEGLDDLDWSESIKTLQRNWIGRSQGAEVDFFIGRAGTGDLERAAADWKTERTTAGFPADPTDEVLRIYTTRPDTLFGATYMVLAPEHAFVERLTTPAQKQAVDAYRRAAAGKSDLDRTDLAKEKTGVFTGAFAINPVNGQKIPIWIADYVLASYGTGAIMAVPAHDLRDWEFAVRFKLPIVPVVQPPVGYEPTREEAALTATLEGQSSTPFVGLGTAINSGAYNDTPTASFKTKITADLAGAGLGREAVNYRLRDWLFSRQHYWGEPFPIWHELDAAGNPTGLLRAVPESELPLTLPEMSDFKPSGKPEPPLAKAPAEWLYKTDADGTRLARETNTMPQWAGSCWYYLRFIDSKNANRLVDPQKEQYWMPVDLYVGGAEHAVLHLLYSRFWHKVLFDRGYVSTAEPFQKLINQGMILGEAELTRFRTASGSDVPADEIATGPEGGEVWSKTKEAAVPTKMNPAEWEREGDDYVRRVGAPGESPGYRLSQRMVVQRTYKMSKSRGNVINPDSVVADYGADALRLYEMFMGPLEATKPWSMSGVEGISRFLARVWRMIVDERADDICLSPAVRDVPPTSEQLRVLHRTIKAVTDDFEKMSFNTAISRLMEFTNEISPADPRPRSVLEPFVLLVSPLAPHLAEELWQILGHSSTLAYEPWPAFDESLIAESEIEIPVQVNGKLRGKVRVPVDADQAAVESAARADSAVAGYLSGKTVVKVVFVSGRLLNFVIK
ncbi:MAG TPA: leucine--tRNA ligase [Planctomycetaceae bacterium]|jgi:leucyl-tRNA synthetase|nr:leucine--tRNA ligase [Planctomycetaceae bacterium]